jgi:hypothetical protein
MHEWKLKDPYLCVTCFLEPTDERLFDVGVEKIWSSFKYLGGHGPWHICRYEQSGKVFTFPMDLASYWQARKSSEPGANCCSVSDTSDR